MGGAGVRRRPHREQRVREGVGERREGEMRSGMGAWVKVDDGMGEGYRAWCPLVSPMLSCSPSFRPNALSEGPFFRFRWFCTLQVWFRAPFRPAPFTHGLSADQAALHLLRAFSSRCRLPIPNST